MKMQFYFIFISYAHSFFPSFSTPLLPPHSETHPPFLKSWAIVGSVRKKRNDEEDEVNECVLLVYFSYVLVRNEKKKLKKVSKEFVTGIFTQLVMLIHDGSVLYFYHRFKLNHGNITWTESRQHYMNWTSYDDCVHMDTMFVYVDYVYIWISCTYGYHVYVDIVFRYIRGYCSHVYTWVLFSQRSSPFIQHKIHLLILHTTI